MISRTVRMEKKLAANSREVQLQVIIETYWLFGVIPIYRRETPYLWAK